MKLTLIAIALALPCLAQAATFSIKMPLEMAQGGALENNSIVFSKSASTPTNPVEPTEPEIVDPFAQEDPNCDPYAVGYPGNSTSKELLYGSWYVKKDLGFEYRSCKLKPVEKPSLLARYSSIIPSFLDQCNPNNIEIKKRLFKPACEADGAGILNFFYFANKDESGTYQYSNYTVQVLLPSTWSFKMEDVDRIEFDGAVCNNLKYIPSPNPFFPITNMVSCDTNVSYSELASKMDKQIIVEIYSK